MFSSFFKLLRLLSSDIEPSQISLGFTLGLVVGLSPLMTIQTLTALVLMMVLRVNLSVFILSFGLVSVIAWLADPALQATGLYILNMPALNELFTSMYNNGFWRILNFNNSVAMGSLVISAVLFLPVVLLMNLFIRKYRVGIERYLANSKLFRLIRDSKIVAKAVSIGEKVS